MKLSAGQTPVTELLGPFETALPSFLRPPQGSRGLWLGPFREVGAGKNVRDEPQAAFSTADFFNRTSKPIPSLVISQLPKLVWATMRSKSLGE